MNNSQHSDPEAIVTRREFVRGSAAIAAAAVTGRLAAQVPSMRTVKDAPSSPDAAGATYKVGIIGCGGRGTGAAANALEACSGVQIVALADVFHDHLDNARKQLSSLPNGWAERARIDDSRCYVGFDAYQRLLASDVDVVILATPPHFRPIHFEAAINAGKHVFFEKPVAVDPTGIRRVLAAAAIADQKKLSVVTGTQRRHEQCYLEAMQRLHDGAIGDIVSARCYWNQEGLWMNPRKPEWSDMEWQLRNWLYFTWLSGDHIVEQHVHNIDVINWAMGAPPSRCWAMGGRQVRTDPAYGHIFDHFAVEFEYPSGVVANSYCRQIAKCSSRVEEVICGTKGVCTMASGRARIEGATAWTFRGENPNPYVEEHKALFAAIAHRESINEAHRVAESTLTAIMGRMAAYTGQEMTWDQALNSKLDLAPATYEFGPLPVAEVAMPGKTALS